MKNLLLILILLITFSCKQQALFNVEDALSTNQDSAPSDNSYQPPSDGGANDDSNNNSGTCEGISCNYIQDQNIESDPQVILAENFENKTLDQVTSRWTETKNKDYMFLVNEGPAIAGGNTALMMTAVGGQTTGTHLWKRLDRIGEDSNDKIHLRFYVKYFREGTHHHSGGGISGVTHDSNWPMGMAGIRPTGDDRFSVRAEIHGDDVIDYYSYWMGMHHNESLPEYYGNKFVGDYNLKFIRDRWTCVELMVKLNNPVTSNNGTMKLWIDGVLVSDLYEDNPIGKWLHGTFLPLGSSGYDYNQEHWSYSMNLVDIVPFEGFRWRSTEDLNINIVSIAYYVTKDPAGFAGKMWYDNVVVARDYIGPIATR